MLVVSFSFIVTGVVHSPDFISWIKLSNFPTANNVLTFHVTIYVFLASWNRGIHRTSWPLNACPGLEGIYIWTSNMTRNGRMNILGISVKIFNTVVFLCLLYSPVVDHLLVLPPLGTSSHLKDKESAISFYKFNTMENCFLLNLKVNIRRVLESYIMN